MLSVHITSYALLNQNWCIFHNLGVWDIFSSSLWHMTITHSVVSFSLFFFFFMHTRSQHNLNCHPLGRRGIFSLDLELENHSTRLKGSTCIIAWNTELLGSYRAYYFWHLEEFCKCVLTADMRARVLYKP